MQFNKKNKNSDGAYFKFNVILINKYVCKINNIIT